MARVRLARATTQATTASTMYATVTDQVPVTDQVGGSLVTPADPARVRLAGAGVRGTTVARPPETNARIRISSARVQGTPPAVTPPAEPLFVTITDQVDVADDRELQLMNYGDALTDAVSIADQVAAVLTDPDSLVRIRIGDVWVAGVRRVRIGDVWVTLAR